jgi:flagellar basal body rod protein FlgG
VILFVKNFSVRKNISMLIMLVCGQGYANANNALYVATSNDVAKRIQLEVVSNNAANTNTIGYEQDSVIFQPVIHKESKKKKDAFVRPKGNYRTGNPGSLRDTGRALDVAVIGEGYFRVLTPRGPRYTLAGSGFVDANSTLVTGDGHPFASRDGQPILFPEQYSVVEVKSDGTVYADAQELGVIGIYSFAPGTELAKEGASMYFANKPGVLVDDTEATVASGVLRASNVNSTQTLTQVIELQRSAESSQELVKNISALERNTIAKMMK